MDLGITDAMRKPSFPAGFVLFSPLFLSILGETHSAIPLEIHAKAWTDAGRIMRSSDTLQINYNGNWMQSMGMQIGGKARLSENLEGGFGFGMQQVYHGLGATEQEKFALSKFINYLSEARLTYAFGDSAGHRFAMDAGSFGYHYAPYSKNLGNYLFRGPVYPGILVSGFQEFHNDTTRSAFLGMRLHHAFGNFRQDVLLSSEQDLPPSFDWSLGYVARYRLLDALEIGGGVNFYHLFPDNPNITSPTKGSQGSVSGLFNRDSSLAAQGDLNPFHHIYSEGRIDTLRNPDGSIRVDAGGAPLLSYVPTHVYTHQGTKVMALFHLDLKRLLGWGAPFGEQDLLLYGEGAIVGVRNQGRMYARMSERMPFMIGFHIPTFGWLDYFSVEVERYTARFRQDYGKLGYDRSLYFKNIAAPQLQAQAQKSPSALPVSAADLAGDRYTITSEGHFVDNQTGDTLQVKGTGLDPENQTADDWKWSLNFEKTVAGHVRFSGQIANDHFVPRPVRAGLINEGGGLSQILASSKDWYFLMRVGYFF